MYDFNREESHWEQQFEDGCFSIFHVWSYQKPSGIPLGRLNRQTTKYVPMVVIDIELCHRIVGFPSQHWYRITSHSRVSPNRRFRPARNSFLYQPEQVIFRLLYSVEMGTLCYLGYKAHLQLKNSSSSYYKACILTDWTIVFVIRVSTCLNCYSIAVQNFN